MRSNSSEMTLYSLQVLASKDEKQQERVTKTPKNPKRNPSHKRPVSSSYARKWNKMHGLLSNSVKVIQPHNPLEHAYRCDNRKVYRQDNSGCHNRPNPEKSPGTSYFPHSLQIHEQLSIPREEETQDYGLKTKDKICQEEHQISNHEEGTISTVTSIATLKKRINISHQEKKKQ